MVGGPIRIVLVDDHQIFLDAMTKRLNMESDFQVVGTACDGNAATEVIFRTTPDLAILDIAIPGRGSFEVAESVRRTLKATEILFLSGFLSDIYVEQALRVKAKGYVLKSDSIDHLLDSIKRCAGGKHSFSADVEKRLRFDSAHSEYFPSRKSNLGALTTRQLEVLQHLVTGKSVKQVARIMNLSEKSIDSHKYRIMHKLGIHDRVELALYAVREGLTNP